MRYLVPAAALAVLGAVVLCVVALPAWLVPDGGLTVPDRLRAENDVRTTMLQALGGLLALGGVGIGAAATLRQVRTSRDGHTIDLFTKAIDQLASEDESVRHGGVYALERLAELDPDYRGTRMPCSRRSSGGTRHGRPVSPMGRTTTSAPRSRRWGVAR